MLRNIFHGICRNSGGRTLLAGAIGVLTGVEHLLSAGAGTAPLYSPNIERRKPAARPRVDYFNIRRTRSELGYTYWVLQGFGKYSSFALFDTWQEAVDEALARLSGRTREEQFEAVGASR